MKGSTVALILGGLYVASRPVGLTSLTGALNPAGQQPKASQQAASGSPKGTGAPAGAGSSSSAGRGGAPKAGGGSQTGTIEDVFGSFDNIAQESVIGLMWNDFNGPDVPPDFSFLQNPDPGTISDIANSFSSGPAPVFGGDQSLIDPETGLVINPDTGLPFGQEDTQSDVVDLSDQVNADSVIFPDLAPPGDFDF